MHLSIEIDRNGFFQFRPKVYLRHGAENETETETEHADSAETETEASDFVVKIHP